MEIQFNEDGTLIQRPKRVRYLKKREYLKYQTQIKQEYQRITIPLAKMHREEWNNNDMEEVYNILSNKDLNIIFLISLKIRRTFFAVEWMYDKMKEYMDTGQMAKAFYIEGKLHGHGVRVKDFIDNKRI